MTKTRMENILRDVAAENKKLKEVITAKDEERAQVIKQVETLTEVNQRLIRHEKEERAILKEKEQQLQQLQQQIEERELLPMIPSHVGTLAQELASSSPSFSKGRSKELKIAVLEETAKSQKEKEEGEEWRNRLGELQRKHEVLKQKEEILLKENYVEKMDKEGLTEELKEFRAKKAKGHEFIASVYELRERLFDAEIKNLNRAMRYMQSFEDILFNSQNIIESVEKDIRKKAADFDKETEIGLIAELLVEICKLRKNSNDYVEALNRTAVEKLERFNQVWPNVDKSKSLRNHFPLFDFFNTWKK